MPPRIVLCRSVCLRLLAKLRAPNKQTKQRTHPNDTVSVPMLANRRILALPLFFFFFFFYGLCALSRARWGQSPSPRQFQFGRVSTMPGLLPIRSSHQQRNHCNPINPTMGLTMSFIPSPAGCETSPPCFPVPRTPGGTSSLSLGPPQLSTPHVNVSSQLHPQGNPQTICMLLPIVPWWYSPAVGLGFSHRHVM